MSMRYLRKILKERGWKAEKLCREGQNNLVLTLPDGKVFKIASSTPPTTSVYALRLADDKLMSYELLKELGVPQPETVVARTAEDCAEMLGRYGEIVIKPVDGAHGRGVTTMIRSITEVEEAHPKSKKGFGGSGAGNCTATTAVGSVGAAGDLYRVQVRCGDCADSGAGDGRRSAYA